MEQILDSLVAVISMICRFDVKKDPRGARRKSLLILLILFVGLQIAVFWSLLNK